MIDYKKQGKRNRQRGAEWERKVRDDLIKQGWFVSKFQNNVEFKDTIPIEIPSKKMLIGKMISAKPSRFRLQSTGFPDFMCWQQGDMADIETETPLGDLPSNYSIIGIECKSKGILKFTGKL